jgi:hypothetical protein
MKIAYEAELHRQLERLHVEIDQIAKLDVPTKLTPALTKSLEGYLKKLKALRKSGDLLLAQTFPPGAAPRAGKVLATQARSRNTRSQSSARVAKQLKHRHGL